MSAAAGETSKMRSEQAEAMSVALTQKVVDVRILLVPRPGDLRQGPRHRWWCDVGRPAGGIYGEGQTSKLGALVEFSETVPEALNAASQIDDGAEEAQSTP